MKQSRAQDALVAERYRLPRDAAPLSPGVWPALDTQTRQDVVLIEVPEPPDLDRAAQRAWAERALAASRGAERLDHPNVVTTHATGRLDDHVMVVAEPGRGETLAELVAREGALSETRVAELGAQLTSALAAAHADAVIHGAICPDAVVVAGDDYRLSHFGIGSAVEDPSLLGPGSVLPTGGSYAAPDRPEGGSAAADVWSLGAVLRFALEGRRPDLSTPSTATGPVASTVQRLLDPQPIDRPSAVDARDDFAAGAGTPKRRRRRRGRRGRRGDAEAGRDSATSTATGTRGNETPGADPAVLTWGPDESTAQPALARLGENGGAGNGRPPAGRRSVPRVGSPVVVSPELAAELMGLGAPDSLAELEPRSDPAEHDDEEAKGPFRSTFSWPPPRTFRIGAGFVIFVVAAVLVLLLVTDGRVGRPRGGTETTPTVAAEVRGQDAFVPEGWVAYEHPDQGYTIAHPPEWTVTEEGGATSFHDPDSGTFLRIDYVLSNTAPLETWQQLEPSLAGEFDEYVRHQIESIFFRSMRAAVWEFEYTERGTPYRAVDLGIQVGDYRYALYFEAHQADWSATLLEDTFYRFANAFAPPAP